MMVLYPVPFLTKQGSWPNNRRKEGPRLSAPYTATYNGQPMKRVFNEPAELLKMVITEVTCVLAF